MADDLRMGNSQHAGLLFAGRDAAIIGYALDSTLDYLEETVGSEHDVYRCVEQAVQTLECRSVGVRQLRWALAKAFQHHKTPTSTDALTAMRLVKDALDSLAGQQAGFGTSPDDLTRAIAATRRKLKAKGSHLPVVDPQNCAQCGGILSGVISLDGWLVIDTAKHAVSHYQCPKYERLDRPLERIQALWATGQRLVDLWYHLADAHGESDRGAVISQFRAELPHFEEVLGAGVPGWTETCIRPRRGGDG